MRALDQFRKFFATVAHGIEPVRPQSLGHDAGRARDEQRDVPPGDKRFDATRPLARDGDGRARPKSSSHPAVWPHR